MFEMHKITPLTKGGYVVKTSAGLIQFGAPPDTIKDTVVVDESVPAIYVLPKKLFSIEQYVSFAEIEFPIYYNFYIAKRRVTVICNQKQQERLIRVMKEALFGPEKIDLAPEFIDGKDTPDFPNIRAEMDLFRINPNTGEFTQIDDVIEFIDIGPDTEAVVGEVVVKLDENGDFVVYDQGQLAVVVEGDFSLRPLEIDVKESARPFHPPIFGVTMLGNSYGFDPKEKNSGLIVWLNRRGIMVDPPVHSTAWLLEYEVNPKLIDTIILTHCHADHDAGTLQKILQEQKINLYTTKTIFESFMRKSEALTALDQSRLRQLVNFKPVIIGQPININGGEFWFRYELHSIPTIGFEIFFQSKSLIYSSDHLYDPELYDKMYNEGTMPKARRDLFMNFPWTDDIIIHECGIPPLHTPLKNLLPLDPEVKKRIFLVHTSPDLLPKDSGFKLAPTGLENTIVLDVKPNSYNGAIELLDLLNHVDIFKDFALSKAKEFLMMVRREKYLRGEKLITRGAKGKNFYIILSGKVIIERNGSETIGSNNDFFGETSIILDEPSNAEVTAKTEVTVLVLSKHDFLHFIEGTSVAENVKNLEKNRQTDSWKLLDKSPIFSQFSISQKIQLQIVMQHVECDAETFLIRQGGTPDACYVLEIGEFEVRKDGKPVRTLDVGDFIGDVYTFQNDEPSRFDFVATQPSHVYEIQQKDMLNFIDKNPGVYLRLVDPFIEQ